MESLNLFIEEIKSQPWQFNVGSKKRKRGAGYYL